MNQSFGMLSPKRAQLEAEANSLRQSLRESRGAHGEYPRLSSERDALALQIHDQQSTSQHQV